MIKTIAKEKTLALFSFISVTDFTKAVKSSDEHDLFTCFELCLIAPVKLISADRE